MMKVKNMLMLLLTAFIWGTAFVAQSVGMDDLGPFSFNCIRNFIGGAALIPVIFFFDRKKKVKEKADRDKGYVGGGLACGLCLFVASSLQQVGMQYTTAGKAGFITAFYIVIVPVLGIFFHRKASAKVYVSVAIALAGLYFLCITESLFIGRGDICVFFSAVTFSFHILVIDHFSPKVDCLRMACVQFFICGLISVWPTAIFETFTLMEVFRALPSLLYTGVLSSGVAYTLQIVGQRDVHPTVASLIFSLESCFSVLAGWVILKESLTPREVLGCVLMFAAIVLAQIPQKLHMNCHGCQLLKRAKSHGRRE